MIIVGAKGHAREILDILKEKKIEYNLFFFDNVSTKSPSTFYNYHILSSENELSEIFQSDKRFALGLGGTRKRKDIVEIFKNCGGDFNSVISNRAYISSNSIIGNGVNIMPFSSIIGNGILGEGVLLNSYASVHHDSYVGDFCELSPGSRILGYCRIGEMCSIGTNAVVLPKISLCDNVIIGAGAVVTKDFPNGTKGYGVPANLIP